jgi:hypothetical protein
MTTGLYEDCKPLQLRRYTYVDLREQCDACRHGTYKM